MKIAVLGHGVVGSGVVELINKNPKTINSHACTDIEIKYILDIRDFNDLPYSNLFVKDFNIILNDKEIEVVVEVIGGTYPAYKFVKESLLSGKSVVTSNKELVSKFGDELLKIAKEKNVNFLFEASVGGGIPIIRPLSQCLAANEIESISGILNGTTNFILTKMVREAYSFDDALKTAQKLGYAEANPSADIDGIDSCRKISILASLAYGKHVNPDFVHTEGISNITLDDVACADKLGYAIKLLGIIKRTENGEMFIMVAPFLIEKSSPLSVVEDVFNAILVVGNAVGESLFYGRGAGKLPTASAVVADIIDCAKHVGKRKNLYWESSDGSFIKDYKLMKCARYISYIDRTGKNNAFISEKMDDYELETKIKELTKENECEKISTFRVFEI